MTSGSLIISSGVYCSTGLGLVGAMIIKAVAERRSIASNRSVFQGRMSAGKLLGDQFEDADSLDDYDEDMSLMQSMGDTVGWLSCLLVALSVLASGYMLLFSWPDVKASGQPSTLAVEMPSNTSVAATSRGWNEGPRGTSPKNDIDPVTVPRLTVGAVFRDMTIAGETCALCPEMTVVPAGSFVLGAGPEEPWQEEWQAQSEAPTTKVTLDQAFAVGRFAITFGQWEACVIDGECAATPSDNGWGKANRPVINVSWSEASQYVSWLAAKTGKPYRLLTEAEREYVARAGTTTAFWFGRAPSPKLANYQWDRTMPVDTLVPNAWGLFHVHGNVSEWTADCWNGSHHGHSGRAAARRTGDCKRRVIKGGAWFNSPNLIRSAARAGLDAASRYKTVGLRVARAIRDVR